MAAICYYLTRSCFFFLSWLVICHKNHRITDPKDKGNSPHLIIIHWVSQLPLSFLTVKTIKDIQGQHSWKWLNVDLFLSLPTSSLSAVSQSNHPWRRQMATENQKNHHKIYLRKVDTTRAGGSKTGFFSGRYLQNEGFDNHTGRNSSLSINTGRLHLRTGL